MPLLPRAEFTGWTVNGGFAEYVIAPAGELVPAALKALDTGGTFALGGIHMSPTLALDYALLYGERVVRSVANNTCANGQESLAEAESVSLRMHVETFPLEAASEALAALKRGRICGAGVLAVMEGD